MRSVPLRISVAATRPARSARGMSRCDTIPTRDSAKRMRAVERSWGGNSSIMRLMVRTVSCVCSVLNTRCPVCAALRAAAAVAWSRISPIMMTSGSCRMAATRASLNDGASTPSSRWTTAERFERCRYSMGSSTVTIILA